MRQRLRGCAFALGGLLAAAGAASSHGDEQPAASRVLLASVTNEQNHALVDLGPDDFIISESGQTREVFAVYVADYPIIVLLDNSSGAQSDLPAIQSGVRQFVSRVGQRFVALGALADPPTMLTSLEDDRTTLLTRLDELVVSQTTMLRPIEAVVDATHAIAEIGSPFSAIVVLSAHALAGERQNTRLLSQIFDSHAIVHVVSKGSPASSPRLEADPLRDLADQTRGYFTTVFSSASFPIALNSLADRLATEVMVEYLVPPGSRADADLRIGVKVPGARVRGLGVSR